MKRDAISVFVFGIYLVMLGTTLAVAPNFLLKTFGVEPTQEVWIRIVGVLSLLIGYMYIQAARKNIKEMFPVTAYARSTIIVFFTAFVLLDYIKPVLILFGLVDFAGALWTMREVRKIKAEAA